MAFFTANSKSFKFDSLPNNKGKGRTKSAFVTGFANAVASSSLSPTEKLAWLKYAGEQLPQGAGQEEIEPVEGPGPGFIPEGGEGQEGGGDAELQQLLASLPGNTPEEKLQAAVELIMQLEGQGGPGGEQMGGEQPGGPGPQIPQGPPGRPGGQQPPQAGRQGNPFAGGLLPR